MRCAVGFHVMFYMARHVSFISDGWQKIVIE